MTGKDITPVGFTSAELYALDELLDWNLRWKDESTYTENGDETELERDREVLAIAAKVRKAITRIDRNEEAR